MRLGHAADHTYFQDAVGNGSGRWLRLTTPDAVGALDPGILGAFLVAGPGSSAVCADGRMIVK